MNITEQIKSSIAELQTAMTYQHPQMPMLLRDIWMNIKANPEQATLLEEEEIQIIVNGLKKQTATEIAVAAIKSSKKGAAKITLADL